MGKVRRRQSYDVCFGDHARQSSGLRKHDVSQVLQTKAHQWELTQLAVRSGAHQFTAHVHDKLQRDLFP